MKFTEIPILMYHDISEQATPWSVSPQNFMRQMEFLKQEGYQTISLDQLQENIDKETSHKLVVLTFDDARSGVYENAFPVLQKLGFKATVFVVPGWIENFETIPEQEKYSTFCNWEQLKLMAGVFEIGSHTFSHRNLAKLDDNSVIQELNEAEKLITTKLSSLVNHFSYPYGEYSSKILELIKRRYNSAVTTKKGFEKSPCEFARQWVVNDTSFEEFKYLIRRPTISLCMIVKNEENHLEKCFSSVQGLVDEIIVVDTGSTDNTKQIISQFTDKVYNFTWNDDFAAARNESLKHATGDWVLVLDADEVINKKDFSELLESLQNPNTSAYQILTRNYSNNSSISGWRPVKEQSHFTNSAQGWYPSLKVRLFRNNKNYSFVGKIHEMIDEKIKENAGNIRLLKIPVHHYGTLKEKSKKTEKYLEISKQKINENPGDAKTYYELGIQHKELGEFELAEEAFKQSLSLNPGHLPPKLNLAVVQQKQNKLDEAIENYQQILAKKDDFADAHFGLGFCYFKKDNLKKALNHFLYTIKNNPDHLDASINAGAVYEKLGRFNEAVLILKNALALNSKSGRAYHNLGVVYQKKFEINNAIKCYEKAIEYNYGQKEELLLKIKRMNEFLAK